MNINHFIDNLKFVDIVLYTIFTIILYVCVRFLWRLNQDKDNTINLVDLVAVGGRLNERKLTRFGAWIISTWGFIYMIANDKLTEWYFIGYMGAWVVNALIGKAIKDPNGEENPTSKE